MSDGHGHIHSLFVSYFVLRRTSDLRAVLVTHCRCWIMWVWAWCNVLFHKMKTHFSRHKRTDRWTDRSTNWIGSLVVNSLHSFTPAVVFIDFPKHLVIPGDTRSSKSSPALDQPQKLFSLPFCCPECDTESKSEQRQTQKTKRICLTDPFLPTYEVIPLHVVSKRKIYPNWGHEKCILIECHNSHTQDEVMWWDPVRKRFVMILLCIYNAHRTVVLSGPIGAAVVMNHSRNMGWLKELPFPHLYDVIRMNSTRI